MSKKNVLLIIFFAFHSFSLLGQFGEHMHLFNMGDTVEVERKLNFAKELKTRDLDSALILWNQVLQTSLSNHYARGVKNASYELMLAYYDKHEFYKVINYSNLLIKSSDITVDLHYIKDAYLAKGAAYQILERFSEAISNYHILLSLPYDLGRENSTTQKVKAYNNIALMLSGMGHHERAIQYLLLADSINVDPDNKSLIVHAWSVVYYNKGNTEKALSFLDSIIQNPDEDFNYKLSIMTQKVLFLRGRSQFQKALAEFEQLIPFLDNDSVAKIRKEQICLVGGFAYYGVGNFEKAKYYLLKSCKDGSTLSPNEKRNVIHMLSHTYYKTKNYKEAYNLHLSFHRIEDSVKSKDVLLSASELETRYRSAEKDRIIAEQRLSYHLDQQRHYRERVAGVGALVGLLLLFLLLFVRYHYSRQKQGKLEARQRFSHLHSLMEGQEKERNRMAQELHDGVNSSLAATRSYLQTIEQVYPGIAEQQHFVKVKQLLLSTSNEIRSIAHNLTPNTLIKDGLVPAIEEFCHNLFPTDIVVEVQFYGQEYGYNENDKLFLYRIAQELLHNVYKHARATEIIVMLGFRDEAINLTIEDNGVGISVTEFKKSGIGVANIKRRLQEMQGRMTMDTELGKGTVVHIYLPCTS